MDPAALQARAAALRALAVEVDDVVRPSRTTAQRPTWQCAHADSVRDALDQQTRAAGACADRLRQHARELDRAAERLAAEQAEQQRHEARRQAEAAGRGRAG